jgi:hypothetical protein
MILKTTQGHLRHSNVEMTLDVHTSDTRDAD